MKRKLKRKASLTRNILMVLKNQSFSYQKLIKNLSF
nr:MAG TPA: hypothetical protein [Caudoviricetes sp.]